MDVMKESRIDWFSIDMEAFEGAYVKCLEAIEKYRDAQRQAEECEAGTCDHERRLKKDGTPDKRYPCPQGFHFYDLTCRLSNELAYTLHLGLFREIGLVNDDGE